LREFEQRADTLRHRFVKNDCQAEDSRKKEKRRKPDEQP
jgi:hypothetical protein